MLNTHSKCGHNGSDAMPLIVKQASLGFAQHVLCLSKYIMKRTRRATIAESMMWRIDGAHGA
jgi:hypothetical protein